MLAMGLAPRPSGVLVKSGDYLATSFSWRLVIDLKLLSAT